MFKNKIDNYVKRSGYFWKWAMSITGHSISHWLLCPVPSWVPNIIGTLGGNSVEPPVTDSIYIKHYQLTYICINNVSTDIKPSLQSYERTQSDDAACSR